MRRRDALGIGSDCCIEVHGRKDAVDASDGPTGWLQPQCGNHFGIRDHRGAQTCHFGRVCGACVVHQVDHHGLAVAQRGFGALLGHLVHAQVVGDHIVRGGASGRLEASDGHYDEQDESHRQHGADLLAS
ncbi:MAG: hypothetical protein C4535_16715 [Comamonadaceae bacterium]|nr:MAG: hypothetical protein C4535_16715 [Comamonadaceae bacterium]